MKQTTIKLLCDRCKRELKSDDGAVKPATATLQTGVMIVVASATATPIDLCASCHSRLGLMLQTFATVEGV